ncbi:MULTISPECIES: PadR family transcriptional regulator [Streptomyces]|uniref:Transcription regulator PadR N-terminal domain-containing protein n=1 Tax=Streptomyces virginiae TaxID=1961 RepID=A0ABQ3NKC2_STRVG|nr:MULTISPECIES: PadR family transcriptional regulator [Streptomyces]KOU88153.1 PadR family transcriptional regulator [Streptomyces sp. XY593]MBP2342884.1 DNA-binding PadR family transcriptional regulator [Streptomyces virginiae]MCI4080314.1 PadR family transcriptional regulator [Streptomyces sp. MMS21 TC-5]QNE28412.1 helix-turn-helix transcriptional regulator [Streptomyces sp. INR7]RST13347.1 PadR family transcriptional regulator [Streptomyces sp. WAC05950]
MRSHGQHGQHGHGHEHGRGHGHCGPDRREGFEGFRAAFGAFGPPFGAGPFGGRGGRGGPRGRARRGDVRASILALLADRPMHGYEMIQEIGERSGGAWKPSPGSVYPTLSLLEDEGLISSESEGGKKLFTLTEAGRTEAEAGPDAPWADAGRGFDFEAMHEVRQAGAGVMEAFSQVFRTGSPEQREKALAVLNDARKKLYLILADEH